MSDMIRSAMSGYVFFANLFHTVTINNLSVPELVQIGNVTSIVLDCDYNITGSPEPSDVTVQWLFGRDIEPVYEWRPHQEPIVRGVLEGRLDLTYKASEDALHERRAIRIVRPEPELSGDYTCVVFSRDSEARQTKSMLVFSSPQDLSLHWKREHHGHRHHTKVEVLCEARGVYPEPSLLLERDRITVDRQRYRSWRNGAGLLLDAEALAHFSPHELKNTEKFTCRLVLPQAGYIAIKESKIVFRNSTHDMILELKKCNPQETRCGNKSSILSSFGLPALIALIAFMNL